MAKKDTYVRLAVLFAFSVLLVVLKYSCLALPTYNDEWNYLHSTFAVYNNHLNPFVAYWAYHPPVFMCSAGLLFKIFGPSLFVARVAMLFFSIFTLYYTFLLGEKLYGDRAGILVGILLLLSPNFMAQSVLFYSDTLVTALTIAAIYYFISGKKPGYFIVASLLVLTKEPAILVPVSIAIYKALLSLPEIITERRQPDAPRKIRKFILETLFILSPLSFFLAWMLLNKLLLGWFFFPVFNSLYLTFSLSPRLLKYMLKVLFWMDYRFLLVAAIIPAACLSLLKGRQRRYLRVEYLLFAILAVIAIIFLAGLSGQGYGFSHRYVFFIQPLLFLAGTAALIELIGSKTLQLAAFALIIFAFVSCWHSRGREEADTNLTYLNIIKTHQEAARYLSENYYSSLIVAAIPMSLTLTESMLGYVKKPCPNVTFVVPERTKDARIVLAISEYYKGWTPDAAKIIKFKQDSHARFLKKFTSSSGEEEISIYSLP